MGFITTSLETRKSNSTINSQLSASLSLSNITPPMMQIHLFLFLFSDVCGEREKLLHMLSTHNRPVLGSLEASTCSPAHFMAKFYNSTLLTWNCPQVNTIRDFHVQTVALHQERPSQSINWFVCTRGDIYWNVTMCSCNCFAWILHCRSENHLFAWSL